jgi:hypothetical protein
MCRLGAAAGGRGGRLAPPAAGGGRAAAAVGAAAVGAAAVAPSSIAKLAASLGSAARVSRTMLKQVASSIDLKVWRLCRQNYSAESTPYIAGLTYNASKRELMMPLG